MYPNNIDFYGAKLDYAKYLLPSKKVGTKQEYLQLEVDHNFLADSVRNYSVVDNLLYVNGKQLATLYDYYKLLELPEVEEAHTRLSADLEQSLVKLINQARNEIQKPRVWDWRKNVITHPSFTKLIQEYRKTKS